MLQITQEIYKSMMLSFSLRFPKDAFCNIKNLLETILKKKRYSHAEIFWSRFFGNFLMIGFLGNW